MPLLLAKKPMISPRLLMPEAVLLTAPGMCSRRYQRPRMPNSNACESPWEPLKKPTATSRLGSPRSWVTGGFDMFRVGNTTLWNWPFSVEKPKLLSDILRLFWLDQNPTVTPASLIPMTWVCSPNGKFSVWNEEPAVARFST